jgi:hypothetical protein
LSQRVTSPVSTGETHAHLKDDARLWRNHVHWTAHAHHALKLAKNLQHLRLAMREQIFKREFPARMPHVAAGEALTAFRTFPERLSQSDL